MGNSKRQAWHSSIVNVRFPPIADVPPRMSAIDPLRKFRCAVILRQGSIDLDCHRRRFAWLGCAGYWAFLRPTKVVFPVDLTSAVESESFRDWLGEPQSGDWFLWGRDMDGRYYLSVSGSLAARRLRKRALRRIEQLGG